ncbi:GlsB/YeaQ/YmgE family stress response membrane protein [Oscillatoria sp. FACHB-1407]|uniref:GlsB/YeaQ/YmgE family stress response membrane protein n=1 Tax=Oscillatoria sp. FACHB-1407 TaxID=2692847 RepID=UPI001687B7F7|nr:GlsB/YeaQ/YmgE family stress response membrane protein [Oscillatoria sp. FACHB-1407]MBD2462478.1 GlsB/YeaQ/YmgE family stress response membrane protein [Oscillatoria sp. FACHB-1407]
MGGVVAWILLGFVAGAVAKLIYPGKQGGGIWATTGLGILGAILGGYLGKALLGIAVGGTVGAFTIPSIALAVIGAITLIFFWGLLTRRPA